MMYEVFDHTADVGIRVRASTPDLLFSEAARGLYALIVANLEEVRPTVVRTVRVDADDIDLMLFDWLSELLYTFESEHLLLSEFDVRIGSEGVTAVCRGDPWDRKRHQLDHEVKAITYHELVVEQRGSEWLAEVIVDI